MGKIKIFLVGGILLLSFFLRLHNYSVYPQRGATADEYAFAFVGISLLKDQKPTSWSAIPLYKERKNITINNLFFPLVTAYLDHPPFYGLVIGGWSLVFGEDRFEKVKLSTIRLVPVVLSVISSLFVFLIGRALYGFKTGIFALLIYATTTIFVVNSRVVVAESLVTPFLLASVFIFSNYQNKLTNRKIVLLGILSGLAFLTKVLGIVVFLTALCFFLLSKIKQRVKLISLFTGTFFAFVLVFIGYGLYFANELFWQIQAYQGSRPLGPQTLWILLHNPLIVNKPYFDGWYFFGFFSLFFAFFDYTKHKAIIVPSVVYLFLFLISIWKTDFHGWYAIPLFPFMALSSAYLIIELIKKVNWQVFVFILFIGASTIEFLYEQPFGLNSFVFRLLLLLLSGPIILSILLKKEKLYSFLVSALFYFFIVANIIITLQYKHPV